MSFRHPCIPGVSRPIFGASSTCADTRPPIAGRHSRLPPAADSGRPARPARPARAARAARAALPGRSSAAAPVRTRLARAHAYAYAHVRACTCAPGGGRPHPPTHAPPASVLRLAVRAGLGGFCSARHAGAVVPVSRFPCRHGWGFSSDMEARMLFRQTNDLFAAVAEAVLR